MGKIRKGLFLLIMFLVVIGVLGACSSKTETTKPETNNSTSEPSQTTEKSTNEIIDITIAGGAQGGTWNVVASALSDYIQKEIPGTRVTVVAGGGVVNIAGIESGEYDIGFAYSSTGGEAINGDEPFPQKMENFKSLAGLYMAPYQLTVNANSDIHSVEDFKGARFAPGIAGFTGEVISKMVLEVYGLSYEDLAKVEYIEYPEAVSLISDGHLDAFAPIAADPTPSIQELATGGTGARIISISDEKIAEIQKINPGYSKYIVKADTYPGQTENAQTIATNTVIYVKKEMPDDLVESILEVMFKYKEELTSLHILMENFTLETAPQDLGAPLHPGAEKYYKEKGVLN